MKFQKITLPLLLALVYFTIIFSTAFAGTFKTQLIPTPQVYIPILYLWHFDNASILFAGFDKFIQPKNASQKNELIGRITDSLPPTIKNTVVIPFEYKQSALYQPFTFKAIDSVINILLENELVTLSIEGYAHVDEGSDSICYYLSLNRALAIKDYIMGRGVDSLRILSLTGFGNVRSIHRKANNQSVEFNCRTEILMNYPIPPPTVIIADADEDGITDSEDKCPDEYGERANNGCPRKGAIIVPFETQQSALYSMTYQVLDSVINILLENPSTTISIEGHACKAEGVETLCDRLSKERADITRRYLLTRNIAASRIDSINSFGNLHPLNACRNPQEIARNARSEIFLNQH